LGRDHPAANSKVADFLFYGICGGTGKPAFKDERARLTAAIFWMKTRPMRRPRVGRIGSR
jgi:hypothetical protein